MLRAYISLIRIHKTIPTLTERYFANGSSSLNHHYSPSITNINNFNSIKTHFPNKSNFKTISQSKQNKQFQNRSFGSYNTDRKNKAALAFVPTQKDLDKRHQRLAKKQWKKDNAWESSLFTELVRIRGKKDTLKLSNLVKEIRPLLSNSKEWNQLIGTYSKRRRSNVVCNCR